MAITATHILTNGSGTDGTSFETASVSLSANKLVLLAVTNRISATPPTTPTVSGASRTWTQVATKDESNIQRTTVFRSLSGSANSGALTIDFGLDTQVRCLWSVAEFTGVDTGGTNGASAIVQSVTDSSASADPFSITLAAFSDAANATYGAIGVTVADAAITEGSGFTELGDAVITEATVTATQSEWRADNDTSVDWNLNAAAVCTGVAIELKIAPPTNKDSMFMVF